MQLPLSPYEIPMAISKWYRAALNISLHQTLRNLVFSCTVEGLAAWIPSEADPTDFCVITPINSSSKLAMVGI